MARQGGNKSATKEKDIPVAIDIDGEGKKAISTGIPFLDHMLELFARHGLFDLEVTCKGDLQIDDHHLVEDTPICLGRGFSEARGDKKGVTRYGAAYTPMDETLARAVVDLSGRSYLIYKVRNTRDRIGTFSVELAEHFWRSFAEHC